MGTYLFPTITGSSLNRRGLENFQQLCHIPRRTGSWKWHTYLLLSRDVTVSLTRSLKLAQAKRKYLSDDHINLKCPVTRWLVASKVGRCIYFILGAFYKMFLTSHYPTSPQRPYAGLPWRKSSKASRTVWRFWSASEHLGHTLWACHPSPLIPLCYPEARRKLPPLYAAVSCRRAPTCTSKQNHRN